MPESFSDRTLEIPSKSHTTEQKSPKVFFDALQGYKKAITQLEFQSNSMDRGHISDFSKHLYAISVDTKKIAPASKELKEQESSKINLLNITGREFLKIPREKRLPYLSKERASASDVASGKVSDITFTFSQNNILNRNVYLHIRAGQLLPNTVESVTSKGKTYSRDGISGEFYTEDTHKRLVIHEGTKIHINQRRTPKILEILKEKKQMDFQKFVRDYPMYKEKRYEPLIVLALEKGIDPQIMAIIGSRKIEAINDATLKKLTVPDLEMLAGDLGRSLSKYKIRDSHIETAAAISVFKKLTPTTWKENMQSYGYALGNMKPYTEKKSKKQTLSFMEREEFTPAEYSYPAERSKRGTTLCSRTARINLAKMGVKNPKGGESAKAAFNAYNGNMSTFSPNGVPGAKVADIFLDASKKNRKFGHRVAAFQKNNVWYALDPYYPIGGERTQKPIPLNVYAAEMQKRGHRFWGVHYFV